MARIKSFSEFCGSLLIETPELVNVGSDYSENFANAIRRAPEADTGHIQYQNGDMIMYHGTKQNPNSMSAFNVSSGKTLYTHANTAKGVGGSSGNIIQNIEKAGAKLPVISDEQNSDGAVSLWRKISEKYPDNTHVVRYNPMTSGYDVIGKLKDIHNDKVWGSGKSNVRVLYDGTGHPPTNWYKR